MVGDWGSGSGLCWGATRRGIAGWKTHSDGWEPIGTGRLPPPGVAKPPSSQAIGVDLPIPEKPTLPRHGASRLGRWHLRYMEYKGRRGDQHRPDRCLRPQPRQHDGVVRAPSTADLAPRVCSAPAAVRCARAADALDKRPAAPSLAPTRPTAACCRAIAPGCTVWILSNT